MSMQTDSAFSGNQVNATTAFFLSLLRVGAALGILAVVAGFSGETNWIADLASQLRVQLALGLFVLLLLFLLARRWWWVLLCMVGFAVNAIPIWPYVVGPASFSNDPVVVKADETSKDPKDQLRLMSLNLLTRNRNWDGVIESVLDASPDFLVLMEIDSVWQQVCESKLDKDYPHAIFVAREDNFGIAFFSKVPLSQSLVFDSEALKLPSIDVTIPNLGAKPLRIIATHPIPPMDQSRWEARNEQLLNVAGRFNETTSNVMVGDFNLTPWSPNFPKVVAAANLKDASKPLGLSLSGLTPTWYVFPTWIGGLKIDHALVSGDVTVQDLSIGQDVGSDHRALILDFSF